MNGDFGMICVRFVLLATICMECDHCATMRWADQPSAKPDEKPEKVRTA